MPSVSGWLSQLRPRLRAVRGGLHPRSALLIATGRHDDVRLRGVRLDGPNRRGVANVAVDVAAGEYAAPGFEIAPGDRVVDVGANVGAFAVWAATVGATVTAYEPHPETHRWLERNTAGLAVECVNAAVVASPPPSGSVFLAVDDAADTHREIAREPHATAIEVPAASLTDAIAPGCDLLKLDCEGAEFDLLTSTPADTLRRARRIACEVHSWHGDPSTLQGRLQYLGYEVHSIPKPDGLSLLFAHRRGDPPTTSGDGGN